MPEIKRDLKTDTSLVLQAHHHEIGTYELTGEGSPTLLFIDNETNTQRIFGTPNIHPYVKDAFHDFIIGKNTDAINPEEKGTKAGLWYILNIPGNGEKNLNFTLKYTSKPKNPVQELENNLALSNIIELKGITSDKVVFGCYVTLTDTDNGEEIKYQLVGPLESDINKNTISVTSPIGRALIGNGIGAEIVVKTPGGTRNFEIIDISA